MAVPPATALHMGYPCMIPACQHYPAMLLPLALSHLESSACISAEGSVSHPVCGSQTVSLQKEKVPPADAPPVLHLPLVRWGRASGHNHVYSVACIVLGHS